jgi:hypothetical protein
MKAEHEDYLLDKMLDDNTEVRPALSSIVDLDIQKPVHGSGYGLLISEEKDLEHATVTFKKTSNPQ